MYVIPIHFATPAYDEVIQLRRRVLLEPLGIELDEKTIAAEYNDYHLACYDDQSKLVAALSLSKTSEDSFNVLHVSVDDKSQSKGVGSYLMEAAEAFAKEKGFKKLELDAKLKAVNFYTRLQYEKVGKPFVEQGIKHHSMEKVLME